MMRLIHLECFYKYFMKSGKSKWQWRLTPKDHRQQVEHHSRNPRKLVSNQKFCQWAAPQVQTCIQLQNAVHRNSWIRRHQLTSQQIQPSESESIVHSSPGTDNKIHERGFTYVWYAHGIKITEILGCIWRGFLDRKAKVREIHEDKSRTLSFPSTNLDPNRL